ncbi:MAG TPA: propionyl-CoA synthetase, partial [Deltaproteobacteria bacterium]|nr:propionyl-CoA synthetase [Deltaproteobacteria bacterium]
MYSSYDEAFRLSIEEKDRFWGDAAGAIKWDKKWDMVLDDTRKPFYGWFAGGRLNTCYNALDFHVENGRADQVAIIYDSPVTGTVKKITYRDLL